MTYLEAFDKVTHGPWTTCGDDVQYRVEKSGAFGRLFFQCSKSAEDWRNNFAFPAEPYKRSGYTWYVHGGFLKAWKSCRDEIAEAVKDFDEIEIVGYSHGAALAIMAHEDYWFTHDGARPRTITFGSPRTIWLSSNVRGRFDGVTNVIVRGDPVAMLPPGWLGYHHAGVGKMVGPWSLPSFAKHEPSAYRRYLGA